jgi:hypothetical protein
MRKSDFVGFEVSGKGEKGGSSELEAARWEDCLEKKLTDIKSLGQ